MYIDIHISYLYFYTTYTNITYSYSGRILE